MCIIVLMAEHKIFSMAVADVYPHYVTKAERKQRTEKEVKQVIEWLTGYDSAGLAHALDKRGPSAISLRTHRISTRIVG